MTMVEARRDAERVTLVPRPSASQTLGERRTGVCLAGDGEDRPGADRDPARLPCLATFYGEPSHGGEQGCWIVIVGRSRA